MKFNTEMKIRRVLDFLHFERNTKKYFLPVLKKDAELNLLKC